MKLFVSVGNTQYNSLIKAIDELLPAADFDITVQLATGSYLPVNHSYIRFTDNISKYYAEADVIIAHAGAGTVFQLLEENRRMVVVPNHERLDAHQLDLAQYVDENNFACVCYEFIKLKESVVQAFSKQYKRYISEPFYGYEYIEQCFAEQTANLSKPNEVGSLPLNIFNDMDDAVNHIITEQGDVIAGSAIAINPEKVIRAMQEPLVREAIMSASIRFADGIGVVKTLARKSGRKVSRIPGCELWEEIMAKSGLFKLPVFLVGASSDVIAATEVKLQSQYQVNICGKQDGYFDAKDEVGIIENISKQQPLIVTVALGSPRQELFIQKCKELCPDTFFMGVGGTYDVYTNKVTRAPLAYRKLNLEWFYRLMSQPQRLFRQSNLLKYLYMELTRKL